MEILLGLFFCFLIPLLSKEGLGVG